MLETVTSSFIFTKIIVCFFVYFSGISIINLINSWANKVVHSFHKGIRPKVNIIAWLGFELAYYNVAFQHINHYTTETLHTEINQSLEYDYCIQAIDLMSRVFANGLGGRGSIPGQVIPKTQKMVLDPAFLNSQHYKVRIKNKVEQFREWSSALPYTSV